MARGAHLNLTCDCLVDAGTSCFIRDHGLRCSGHDPLPSLASSVETCRILCANSQRMKQPEGPENVGLSFQWINSPLNPTGQVWEAASFQLHAPAGLGSSCLPGLSPGLESRKALNADLWAMQDRSREREQLLTLHSGPQIHLAFRMKLRNHS